ncbi:MAG: acyl-CoA dehydrogenase family protein, partial [Alphaproteobacteria bacterium]|nr:acyl-CoA dehydrogenase family protein [Alphaproteobacteria bacterium]
MTPSQSAIVEAVGRICEKYDDAYWLARDTDHRFPEEFVRDIAAGGFLGMAMPEGVGGAGLGVTESAYMMRRIASSGAGMTGVSAVHINMFGPHPVAVFGTDEQKQRILPPLIRGETRCCFGVTEPDAGLDTASLKTRAERTGNHWLVNGRKMWTTTAQTATHILLLARTSPKGKRPTDGLSLFYTALDRAHIEVREIAKMGRHAVDTNMLFIDGLLVPGDDLIGEEGKGFDYLLHAFNPERILVAA